jgi:CheY-like chemotaxis protein
MKLLITAYCDQFSDHGQEAAQASFEQFINTLKTASDSKKGQTIELHNDELDRTEIDSVLNKLDIANILNPNMPNMGGMEVLATIRQDLSHKLETLMAAQNN